MEAFLYLIIDTLTTEIQNSINTLPLSYHISPKDGEIIGNS